MLMPIKVSLIVNHHPLPSLSNQGITEEAQGIRGEVHIPGPPQLNPPILGMHTVSTFHVTSFNVVLKTNDEDSLGRQIDQ